LMIQRTIGQNGDKQNQQQNNRYDGKSRQIQFFMSDDLHFGWHILSSIRASTG